MPVTKFSFAALREHIRKYLWIYIIGVGACLLLTNTDMSLRDVSQAVGLADQSYFSRIFKEKTGVTPARYRKLYTGNMYEL